MPRPRPPSPFSPTLSRVRTADQAIKFLVRDLIRGASCVCKEQLSATRLKDVPDRAAISFLGRSARAKVRTDVWISVDMTVEPRRDDSDTGSWRTHTLRYNFSLFPDEREQKYLLAYHYHPGVGVDWPHAHISGQAKWLPTGLRKGHLATGRMTIESFAFFLIEEMNVKPRRAQWERDLRKTLDVFQSRRTW